MREPEENGQTLYSVSEAVRETGVPSHVLRYWEDELHLSIRRSSQGHRIYCMEDIATFRKVKELKEKGIQLKAIRLLLEDSGDRQRLEWLLNENSDAGRSENASRSTGEQETPPRESSAAGRAGRLENASRSTGAEYEIVPTAETDNYRRFESMLRGLIMEALAEQNEKLEQDISDLLHEEFEDLYIQFQQELSQREAAAAKMNPATETKKMNFLQRFREAIKGR